MISNLKKAFIINRKKDRSFVQSIVCLKTVAINDEIKEPGTFDVLKQPFPQKMIESNDLKPVAVEVKLSHIDKVVKSSENSTLISNVLPKDVAKT